MYPPNAQTLMRDLINDLISIRNRLAIIETIEQTGKIRSSRIKLDDCLEQLKFAYGEVKDDNLQEL